MNYSIELTNKAHKSFKRLSSEVVVKIAGTIDLLAIDPFTLDIKKLKTPFDGYRVRTGDYRILFTITKKNIVVYAITHRKDAYRL